MLIDIYDNKRQKLYAVTVDTNAPPTVVKPNTGDVGPQVSLNWDSAFDDEGHLRHCAVCGCRELFVRNNFPQVTGLVVIVLAAVVSMVLFGMAQVMLAFGVLIVVAILDALIYLFTGRCLVCYRCRSEYRQLPIHKKHDAFERATDEKYRQVNLANVAEPAKSTHSAKSTEPSQSPHSAKPDDDSQSQSLN